MLFVYTEKENEPLGYKFSITSGPKSHAKYAMEILIFEWL